MYHFTHDADLTTTLDLTPHTAPDVTDRTGTPLSQGIVLTLLATVASDYLPAHILDQVRMIDPEGWYSGQALEDMLTILAQRDPALPAQMGKNLYYIIGPQFRAMGMDTPARVLQGMPHMWTQVVRGAAGEWRLIELGDGHAILELDQPFNCLFEAGGIQGSLEAVEGTNVQVTQLTCMRRGDTCCRIEIEWQE